jgi:hypothetical protein
LHFATLLRRELSTFAEKYARYGGSPYRLSYGDPPTVCFPSEEQDQRHGNFLIGSYKAIQVNPAWSKRLKKVHTQGRRCLPSIDGRRWRELDSCTSSDALLMNVICHPSVSRAGSVWAMLGAEAGSSPCFGYKARVPLQNGRFDRTEIDLRLGTLLVEAKLTENDFQSAEKSVLRGYRDFAEVFHEARLPQTSKRYLSYQLLRNVLAAYALECSFSVLVDARRPDLVDAWYSVMKCVQPFDLRTRLRISTWQELAKVTPPAVQAFLAAKYGIRDQPRLS